MHELKKWAEKYRQLCVLLGIFGLLLSPFLWPFFLAILLNSLSLAVPVLVVLAIVDYTRRGSKSEDENNREQGNEEKVHPNAEEPVSEEHPDKETAAEEEPVQKEKQKRTEPVKSQTAEGNSPIDEDPEYNAALSWYRMEGQERIFRILGKLEKEGIHAFSVSPEGICTVREERRFRRVGVLRAFPQRKLWKAIERELHKEGIRTNVSGKYLWISRGREMQR